MITTICSASYRPKVASSRAAVSMRARLLVANARWKRAYGLPELVIEHMFAEAQAAVEAYAPRYAAGRATRRSAAVCRAHARPRRAAPARGRPGGRRPP